MSAWIVSLRWVARVAGMSALALGLLLWSGLAGGMTRAHMVAGGVFALALLVLVAVGARAGAPGGRVVPVAVVALVLTTLGWMQGGLLPGSAHWVVRGVHLLTGGVALGFGDRLAGWLMRLPSASPAVVEVHPS